MSKAILGFGVSVTRLAALAGSKLASTPSNDDIVKLIQAIAKCLKKVIELQVPLLHQNVTEY